jgi:uncharacterized protein YecE (DUF72 family)
MDFGKIEASILDTLDLTLPIDAARTVRVLSKSEKPAKPKVFVGCAKWARKDWVGKIYPRGVKDKEFLGLYAKQFNSIEFNAIYYNLPSHEQVRSWKSKVGKDFLFCPKFTEVITHGKRLKNAQQETDVLLDVISEFGENLGPMFLLPHPHTGPQKFEDIKNYLESLPRNLSLFLELRNYDWFKEENKKMIFDLCEELNVGTVITDTAGRRDCVHMELTTPSVFIRFVGNSLHQTDYKRIDNWVQRIKQWLDGGIQGIYFFMHQHDELHSPELAKYLIDELNAHCGLNLTPPVLLN